MKLTEAQRTFITDRALEKCLELYISTLTVGGLVSDLPSKVNLTKSAQTLFTQCLDSFDVTLIPPCSTTVPAFISYFEGRLKFVLTSEHFNYKTKNYNHES
jgi:hypothetical protein